MHVMRRSRFQLIPWVLLQHVESSGLLIAPVAARLAMLAVDAADDAAGSLPKEAALPVAVAFHALLQVLERVRSCSISLPLSTWARTAST